MERLMPALEPSPPLPGKTPVDLGELQRQDLVRSLLYKEKLHPLVAEAVAARLDRMPPGKRVGLYGCGSIARVLVAGHGPSLARHRPLFLVTDPQGMDTFQGYPVAAAAALRKQPPDLVLILNVRFEEAMAAQVDYLPPDRVHRLRPLLQEHGLAPLLERVEAAIHRSVAQALPEIEARLPAGRKRILFLTSNPPLHLVKIMAEAVRQGYGVVVVADFPRAAQAGVLRGYADQGWFHALHLAEYSLAREFLLLERSLAPHVDHLEVSMEPPHAADLVLAARTAPVAVEYRDFPQTVFRNREDALRTLGRRPEEYDQEQDAHRRIYLGADGIIMKDAPETLDFLEGLYRYRPPRVLQFLPYVNEDLAPAGPVEKLSARTGEPHVVYAGGVVDDPGWHNYPICHSLLTAGRILADQGIHLTVYNAADAGGGFQEYRELDRQCRYFHYHPQVPYRDLKDLLPRHDFGWFCFDFREARENPLFHRITFGSKVFTYLEAGLPVLISPEQEFMARMVTETLGSGITVPFQDLHRLGRVLREQDWPRIRARMAEARSQWTYARHGHELRAFYDALAGSRP
jgi:hypothetical protein